MGRCPLHVWSCLGARTGLHRLQPPHFLCLSNESSDTRSRKAGEQSCMQDKTFASLLATVLHHLWSVGLRFGWHQAASETYASCSVDPQRGSVVQVLKYRACCCLPLPVLWPADQGTQIAHASLSCHLSSFACCASRS